MAEKNNKATINRNQIYLGKLYAKCQDEISGQISYVYCRHVLLRINEANLAHDLVYSTLQNYYPIEGIESPTIHTDKRLLIKERMSLTTILFILGFKEQLSIKDLSSIFHMLLEKKESMLKQKYKFVSFADGESLYNDLIKFLDEAAYKPDSKHERFNGKKPQKVI